ncbi:MAG: PAS domain-containing protein [Planctomycetes bacterium]|nr:PAS domain-containing protein [Planctomycetota bacterium]
METSPASVRGAVGVTVHVDPAQESRAVVVSDLRAPDPRPDDRAPAVLTVDAQGLVSYLSAAAEALGGARRGEAVGRPLPQALGLAAQDGAALADDLRRVLAGDAATARRTVRSPAGPVEVRLEPIAAGPAGGAATGAVVVLTDEAARARAAGRARALDGLERIGAAESVEEAARVLVEALVPTLGDLAMVRVLERDGAVTARTHRDPEQEAALWALEPLLPVVGPAAPPPGRAVLRLERARLVTDLTPALAGEVAGAPEVADLVRDLDVRSLALVPFRLRGGVAVLAVARAGERDALEPADLDVAEALVRRAALVLDRLWTQRRLRQAVHTRERMLSTLGHDLINPAAAISLAADILISRLPAENGGNQLKAIRRNANDLTAMIQKIIEESASDAAVDGG